MRLSKVFSAWFPYPNDPDKAEFMFKLLSPGERADVNDAMAELSFTFKKPNAENDKPDFEQTGKPTTKKGRELEIDLATLDWKNVFDPDGKVMKVGKENKLEILRKQPGFWEWYESCRAEMEKKQAKENKAQEKNS